MAEPANTIQETPVNGKIPLNPLRVDIVGDFAGKGLFAIHGEALLQHCLEQAKVDVNDGFQVLHAVYAVEDLLSKLATRGCNFHIVWFEYPMYPEEASSKFRAIRIILVEHFARLGNGLSYLFPSPASDAFQEYLRDNSIRFFWGSGTITRQMLSLGHCVAFIQDVEFKSSKVYTRMVTPLAARDVFEQEEEQPNSLPEASAGSRESLERLVKSSHDHSLTARELLSLHALSDILRSATSENSESISRQAAALLVHLVALRHIPLSQRSIDIDATASKPNPEVESFMSAFSDAVRDAAIGWSKSSHAELAWDAFDLIDGRLYSVILARVNAGIAKLGSELAAEAASLAELLTTVTGTDVSKYIPGPEPRSGEGEAKQHLSAPSLPTSVLPFSHPVLDPYLIKVQLESKDKAAPPPAPKIFAELTHWHNAKKPVDPKRIPPPLDFKARRRNQRFMADTMAYSASLTGASGKNIKPEIIVSSIEVSENKKAAAKLPQRPKPVQSAPKKKVVQKSGAQKAREEGERMKAEKTAVKSGEIVVAWKARCAEFEKEITPLRRYLKAEKYFLGLSPSHMEAISGEVILYIASVLVRMAVAKSQKAMDSTYFAINAMIWSRTIQASRLSLTKDIFNKLVILANSLRIPVQALGAPPAMARALAFKWPDIERSLLPKEVSATEFQLNFCGPYMDRSFDSAPDPRVTFPPDAWQRDVLDAIDARTSVLAIAPTSAGKTFISFYAMKKVLQANDDDVLVYIAPTKALVNQIAAEVQARFSKSYRQEGRSVWAIHTRDHRVNNPRGCQVLVTVPSMLQILLLAPSNAEGPKSFSNRLKWIIFDEVHSIGQSEEGVIWEQLLLMAPCPIIALSATVGNTLEFKDWLEGVQKAKGFDFRMVVHTSRYSDLRKFIHDPEPSTVVFKGLVKPERLPLPGLDSEADYAAPFYFVHPVAGIVEKSRETLGDTSLEPRDCLSLWKSMVSKQVDSYQVDNALDPELALPKLIQKSDVVGWESSLKNQLGEWIGNPLASPFEKVRQELLGPRYPQVIARYTGDMTAFTPEETETGAAVSSRSVFSLILDLRASGALPAIIFNYDRTMCEDLASEVLGVLIAAETKFRETDPTWIRKMDTFREWEKARDARLARTAKKAPTKRKGDDEDDGPLGKAESARDEASQDGSAWASFDPEAPLPQYSFADSTSMTASELEERLWPLQREAIPPALINGLRRGIGVHHAGLNRKYRQAVEMLFRKGYLQVVMATGTLAMGINMPCKTVVFSGDSVYITALNYRQASGRAGRRGFDLLGNVVFHNINPHRSFEIMSAKLPDLRGQFPTSVTLILRLFTLLHGTNNAEFGKKMVAAVFSQSRLYLGGPEDQYSVAHHLRFSIDYLRRQNLLSEKGEPLNFAGLVGHLYYAENAVFAFHSLLREGYFHEICSQIDDETKQADILLEIMLVLCHLFCRFPCHQYKNETFIREVVYRSPSLIILPDLPVKASDALERHNKQTLDIFRGYVSSYIHQHLSTKPDNELPFSKIAVKPAKTEDLTDVVPIRPPTAIRSPFAALSGFTDDFETIKELCDTVRSDVFLEESAIPYIPIAPKETNGVPWNAYLYDFFKHGDVDAIVRDNGVRRGEVWYLLKDYSFILATITTSLANTLNPSAVEGDDIIGDTEVDEELGGDRGQDDDLEEAAAKPSVKVKETPVTVLKKKGKKKVADSWDDEESSEAENWDDEGAEEEKEDTPAPKIHQFDPANADQSLVKVYKAFSMLKEQFDEKFYKMWA